MVDDSRWANPPTEFDFDLIGRRRVRLDVPFVSQASMKPIGQELVKLGQRLIRYSMQGPHDVSERTALMTGKNEAILCQRALRQIYKAELALLEERRDNVTAIRR